MRSWSVRHWAVAFGTAVLAALVIGVPTMMIPSPFFSRAVPVTWWSYPIWGLSAVLEGLLIATYVRTGEPVEQEAAAEEAEEPRTTKAIVAGLLSTFAVGCPVCNKIVVLALGVSGALSYFAPVQPFLGIASVGLLIHALVKRLRNADSCPVPARPAATS